MVGGVVEQRGQPGPFDAPASGDARFEMRCVGIFTAVAGGPVLRPLAALRQGESGVGEQSVGGVQAQFPAGVEAGVLIVEHAEHLQDGLAVRRVDLFGQHDAGVTAVAFNLTVVGVQRYLPDGARIEVRVQCVGECG